MSKFKIEKGISRINRVKLQASIEEPVATELALMCEWSSNDRNYVVNELLRFALSQDGEFQAYKESVDVSGGGKAQAPTGSAGHEPQWRPRPNRPSQNPLLVLVSR
jgi:hypothetical protein